MEERRKLEDLEMAAMLHGGATLEEIAGHAGITRERVRQRLGRIGVFAAKRIDVVRLLDVVRTEPVCSLRELSRAIGVSQFSIARALGALGLTESVERLLLWRAGSKRRAELEQTAAALRDYARMLGRTPGMKDLLAGSRPRDIPCLSTLQKRFGSLTAAQRAAGLLLNRKWGKKQRRRRLGFAICAHT